MVILFSYSKCERKEANGDTEVLRKGLAGRICVGFAKDLQRTCVGFAHVWWDLLFGVGDFVMGTTGFVSTFPCILLI